MPRAVADVWLITCEHGGNRIPAPYRALFASRARLLATHRGYDAGALRVAQALARTFGAPLVASTVSRLLIDLNRSLGHPHLYSDATRELPPAVRQSIVDAHYLPYRNEVEQRVQRAVRAGARVIHLSSHSFTPELHGEVRNADIGLLYDPRRRGEVEFAKRWQHELQVLAPRLAVRRNYPYRGKNDGLTSHLRKRFSPKAYVGIEIEVNQKYVIAGGRAWREVQRALQESLRLMRAKPA